MNLSPTLLKAALLDAQQCNGIAPTTSQMLIDEGWAEWVDYEFGTPIDENSPRSLMRLTAAGTAHLATLEDMPVPQPFVAKPIITQPTASAHKPKVVSGGFPIRFRARVAA